MDDDAHDPFEAVIAKLERLVGSVPGVEAELAALRAMRSALAVSPPSALALSGGKAAATHAVAAETISRSLIVTGGTVGIYGGPIPETPDEALATYRRFLVTTTRHLPLRGIDVGAGDPSNTHQRFELAQIYVDLETWPSSADLKVQPGRLRLVPAPSVLKAVVANRRLVLLGEPGSGKSTFLNHLSLCLAAHSLDGAGGWIDRLPGWPEDEAELLPVPVLLRDFARWLDREPDAGTRPVLLWRFIARRLHDQNLGAVEDALYRAIDGGRAIVLLDGLDEVPTAEGRTRIRTIVDTFAQRHDRSRILVTCRTLSYQDPKGQLRETPWNEIAPFNQVRIERFIDAWYRELGRAGLIRVEEASGLARALREAVRRDDLARLAPNPLLLTVMALVHTHKGRLPDARARLYEDTVDLLLWRWDELRVAGTGDDAGLRHLLREANLQDVDLLRTLWQLAHDAHAQTGAAGDETLADISEAHLEVALARLHPRQSRDWAMKVIEVMKLRAGLLLERSPAVYTFPHRTFQEYLAGSYLASQANFATNAVALDVARWRVVILLAVGRLVYVNLEIDRPLQLVDALGADWHTDRHAPAERLHFAVEVLFEIGTERVLQLPHGRAIVDRLRDYTMRMMTDPAVDRAVRAVAGDDLDRLGDLRFDPERFWLPYGERHGFEVIRSPRIAIHPSEVLSLREFADILSSEKSTDWLIDQFLQGEYTPDTLSIDGVPIEDIEFAERVMSALEQRGAEDGLFVARYPVTIAQYNAYLEELDRPDRPLLRDRGNRPATGVSFAGALDYCRWLTSRMWENASGVFFPPLAPGLGHRAFDASKIFGKRWRFLPSSRKEWLAVSARCSLELTGPAGGRLILAVGSGLPATPGGTADLVGNVREMMRDQLGQTTSGGLRQLPFFDPVAESPSDPQGGPGIGFRLVWTDAEWSADREDPPEPEPVEAVKRA